MSYLQTQQMACLHPLRVGVQSGEPLKDLQLKDLQALGSGVVILLHCKNLQTLGSGVVILLRIYKLWGPEW